MRIYRPRKHPAGLVTSLLIAALLMGSFAACAPQPEQATMQAAQTQSEPEQQPEVTPFPTRRQYEPGELVDYTAQTGDTLPALAAHFNTTIAEIRKANPILPQEVTTLPPGMPMQIPIYYQSLWGSAFQIIPDNLFVYGPAQIGFNITDYVATSPGWFKYFSAYAGDEQRTGGAIIEHIATNFSISPRLLIAILEYQTGALTHITAPRSDDLYPLGLNELNHQGLYAQMVLAANLLNNAYYSWRNGSLRQIEFQDGRIEIPDPWQNAATVALHAYFAQTLTTEEFDDAVNGNGLLKTYSDLFGDPWENVDNHIPGSLTQPEMMFPFLPGYSWAYTGGPHTGWGEGQPFAAIDFAPPSVVGGCEPSDEWVAAVADGIVVRDTPAVVALDLDGDGYEQTGWVVFYLHISTRDKVKVGMQLKAGDPMGHPSCEGGRSTGTHIHIARKYNGEWIMADGPLAFNLEGWIAHNGTAAYEGTLERYGQVIRACLCSDFASQIQSVGKN
jgi:LasA protease